MQTPDWLDRVDCTKVFLDDGTFYLLTPKPHTDMRLAPEDAIVTRVACIDKYDFPKVDRIEVGGSTTNLRVSFGDDILITTTLDSKLESINSISSTIELTLKPPLRIVRTSALSILHNIEDYTNNNKTVVELFDIDVERQRYEVPEWQCRTCDTILTNNKIHICVS